MPNQPPNPSRRRLFTWLTDSDAAAAIGAEAGRAVRAAREAGQELSQALQEATDQVSAAVNAPEPEPPLPANLRTHLIDLLVATPGMDDPEGRKALLFYIGFAGLSQTVDLHGAPLTVASRLLSAVAGSGKTALSQFLTAWETWPGVGEARQGQLAAMAAAVAGLSEAAVQGALVVETPESLAELQTQYTRLADAVAGLQTADGTDRQLLVEIASQLQQLHGMISAQLPQAQTAAEQADLRHLAGLTQTLITLFVGATGAALYEAFIGDTVYPTLKEWVMELLQPGAAPAQPASPLPRPDSPLAQPESPLQPQVEGGWGRHVIRLGACPPLEMVHIPAGWFVMGTDRQHFPEAQDIAAPPHQVHLDAYAISRTPVTVAQFGAFVTATGYRTTAEQEGWGYVYTERAWERVNGASWRHPRGPQSDVHQKQDHPVTQVSWHDASAFCQWAHVRLPTEAEWEKAARGDDARIYPWGNESPDKTLCNFNKNVGDTTPVGAYPRGASPYGLLDMAGNVWEWTADWYDGDYYAHSPKVNPKGPATGEYRTVRGGSWYYNHHYAAAVIRVRPQPDDRVNNVGFRVVCAVPVP